MTKFNLIKPFFLLSVALIFLSSCEALKYRPVSAKDYPPDPKERRGLLPATKLVAQTEDVIVDKRGNIYVSDKNHGIYILRYTGLNP